MAQRRVTVLERLPAGARVALVRLRSLGDCVLTTPAIRLLKGARPDLEIAVVVEERFAAVFEGNPDVSVILPSSYASLLRWRPALCVNLHGGARSRLLTLASLAPVKAGFAHQRGAWIYGEKIPRAQEILGVERVVHTAEHLASAMFHLGAPRAEVPRAQLYADPAPLEGRPYAVIHPAAALPYKQWRSEGFLDVAGYLDRERGLEPVFIGAASDDMSPFRRHRVVAGAPLGRIKSLLAGASLFIGNDSGPAHMACALGRPVVVLYGRQEHLQIWAPWRPVAARTIYSPAGVKAIAAREVIRAAAEIG